MRMVGYSGYGRFMARACAAVIDNLVLWVAMLVVNAILSVAFPHGQALREGSDYVSGFEPGDQTVAFALAYVVASIVLHWLYFAGLESSAWMGTLGKRALDLRVTDMEGRRVGFGRATGRHFGKMLSTLTLGVGYLMVLFNERRQGLHDKVAGTLVLVAA